MADGWPTLWHAYSRMNRKDPSNYALWARFASRYRAANCFRGAEFDGLGLRSASGYSAGIGVLLAYSALEMAHTAGDTSMRGAQLVDQALAKKFRQALGRGDHARFPLFDSLTDRRLKEKLERVVSGASDDVMPVCSAYRHLMAHGHFTPWGAEVHTAVRQRCLVDLKLKLLSEGDRLLDQHYLQIQR